MAQPIFGGQPTESYIGLSAQQQNAVVMVQFDDVADAAGLPCSGVLVAPDWVLTAKHCIPGPDAERVTLSVGADRRAAELVVQSSDWREPPDAALDAILIRLEDALPAALAEPLRLSGLAPESLIGARVLLAGFGVTDDNLIGLRRFVTEPVTAASAAAVTVDGQGQSGACVADSGGPLIWREGMPAVVGILEWGDQGCRDLDHYTSVAPLRSWIAETTQFEPSFEDCGAITAEGVCFDSDAIEQAIWCDAGQLVAARCEQPNVCGWDAPAKGYRCVPPESDTCRGVSQLGACTGGRALRCTSGELVPSSCDVCETCAIDPATGSPSCRPNYAGDQSDGP